MQAQQEAAQLLHLQEQQALHSGQPTSADRKNAQREKEGKPKKTKAKAEKQRAQDLECKTKQKEKWREGPP